MANDYLCPICRGHIRVGDALVISVKSEKNKKGLIFLNPEIGNYTTTTHPTFEIKKGEEYTVYCPICHANLNREENPNLVKVHMVDNESHDEYEIYFSGVVGEECTYKIKDKEVQEFGPDANHYRQYFGVPKEDMKYLKK